MPIPESQLEIWSRQGAIAGSQGTYATIRTALEATDAPYRNRSHLIFLQGSYGNDTNIYADSDVDIVVKTESVYYSDTSGLKGQELENYKAAFVAAEYTHEDFKRDVVAQLTKKFPSAIKQRNKAIFIEGSESRRNADVIPAAQFRKYTRFSSVYDQAYVDGICFWAADGTQIINYPKLHSANCTAKHQGTKSRFKPIVRIFKNLRNRMIDLGRIPDGLAPSYFIEGLLYNVPSNQFVVGYQDTIVNVLNWIVSADRSGFLCANEQYFLCHPTSPVTWRRPR